MTARRVALVAGYAALVAAGWTTAACRGVTDPVSLPAGAVPFASPAVYARWWALTETCSGHTGDLAAVRWYVVPGVDSFPAAGAGDVAGYWSPAGNRIVLAGRIVRRGDLVRHEMLHALLGPAAAAGDQPQQHPPTYFQGRCAGYVSCVGACLAAGPPYAPPPAAAPVLAPAGLRLTVEAVPGVVTRVPGDSGVTVVVRATNPRPVPVWVQLGPAPGFGYGVGAAGAPFLSTAGFTPPLGDRIELPGGGSTQAVIDVDLAGAPPGAYVAVGSFNTAGLSAAGFPSVTTPFQIAR